MRFATIFLALCLAVPLHAADPPAPQIDFPVLPVPVPPVPPPLPPSTPTKLLANQEYIVAANVQLLVFASPPLVNISQETGPVRIRAQFVDGKPNTVETRLYKQPYIYIVEAGGKGLCDLIVITPGITDPSKIIRKPLDVDDGVTPIPPVPPVPPIPPVPPVPPVPPTPPAPIPASGLHVLVVYDSGKIESYPAGQQAAMFNANVRAYLNTKCPLGPDGKTHEWRMWPDGVDTSTVPKLWQDAMARPRASLPWIVISNGTTGYEGPLPVTAADMLALLQKYGGA